MSNNYLQEILPMIVQIYWFFKVAKSFNKLGNKLQSLNIQTCEPNTTSKAKYVCVCIYIYIWKNMTLRIENNLVPSHQSTIFKSTSSHTYINCVTTLALGLRPRQGVARLQAKRETRETHHMLPGVQRMWGSEPSFSQVSSHCGSWSPKWTPKFSEHNFKGQNPSVGKVLYIIEKLLKRRCLKWAHITHLDI
jgi:hypothetical protein